MPWTGLLITTPFRGSGCMRVVPYDANLRQIVRRSLILHLDMQSSKPAFRSSSSIISWRG